MKRYHLTILRDGEIKTIFGEMTSIETFLLIEYELGRKTHIMYSRELSISEEEWEEFSAFKK